MESIKNKLKQFRLIVRVYEMIMNSLHQCKRNMRAFKRKLVKTRFSYGKCNPDKVFHVIKSDAVGCGMFSLILVNVLPYLGISEKKGYIPIVDYKNTVHLPLIQDECEHGKDNPWEYYFEQPGGAYTLDEVYRSSKVEICNPDKYGFKVVDWNNMMPMSTEELKYWSRLANKYIRPTKEIRERIEVEKKRLFSEDEKMVGISIRAGYRRAALFNLGIIKGHPKVGSCEDYIEIIQKKLDEWGYSKFFLACEDREYVEKISAHFGKRCCRMNRRYQHLFINGNPVPNDNMKEINREYEGCTTKERAEEYIVETYLLAACDSLYSTINGGAEFAYIVNGGKYKYMESYSEGHY